MALCMTKGKVEGENLLEKLNDNIIIQRIFLYSKNKKR
jgi:hypothetical protein